MRSSYPLTRVSPISFGRLGGYPACVDLQSPIHSDPDILGGEPVIRGTRVPVKTLFDYLEDNYSLSEFVECFPSVTIEMAKRVLESSASALLAATCC